MTHASKNSDEFFSSSRSDDRSDFEVGEVHQDLDNEKGGEADLRRTLMNHSNPAAAAPLVRIVLYYL